MNTFTVLAIAATAMAATTTTVSAAQCSYPAIAPQLHSLAPEVSACAKSSGYNMINPPKMPTAEQQWALCMTCKPFITKATTMQWPDCTLNLAGTQQTLTQYFTAVTSPCAL